MNNMEKRHRAFVIRMRPLLALALAFALMLTAFDSLAGAEKAHAAENECAWVLTKEQVFLFHAYSSDKDSQERAQANGWGTAIYNKEPGETGIYFYTSDGKKTMEPGRTVNDNGAYSLELSYLGKFDGIVRFYQKGEGLDPTHSGKGYAASEVYSECTVPEKVLKPGQKLELKLHGWMENLIDYSGGYCLGAADYDSVRVYINDVTKMRDSDGEYFFTIKACDFSKYDDEFSTIVSETMPTASKEGETCTINFYTGYGSSEYRWTYTYQPVDDEEDSLEDVEDDIVVGKVKNVKLTNKKTKHIYMTFNAVDDADGYEVQYAASKDFSDAVKFSTKSTKGYFVKGKKKITFKKGVTYYVRVRAYIKDDDGDKVYGDWSATQSVKIKK